MGFLLRVLEEDGDPVRAGFRPTEFPVLGTLDPYGDTSLNYLRCELLEAEIERVAVRLGERGVAGDFIAEVVRLGRVGRARPQRRLTVHR